MKLVFRVEVEVDASQNDDPSDVYIAVVNMLEDLPPQAQGDQASYEVLSSHAEEIR